MRSSVFGGGLEGDYEIIDGRNIATIIDAEPAKRSGVRRGVFVPRRGGGRWSLIGVSGARGGWQKQTSHRHCHEVDGRNNYVKHTKMSSQIQIPSASTRRSL